MSMKASEIRALSPEERKKKLEELRMELIRLKLQAATGVLDNPGKIRAIKRTIARILTIMREEELKTLKEGKKKK